MNGINTYFHYCHSINNMTDTKGNRKFDNTTCKIIFYVICLYKFNLLTFLIVFHYKCNYMRC